jgi:DUF971 family protein
VNEVKVEATPRSIRQAGSKELEIVWADGHVSLYPVVELRRGCRCATCVNEWTGETMLDPGSIPEDVKPVRVEPVGRYAIQFEWSDGHTTGIYSFDFLRSFCPCAACRGEPSPETKA